MTYNITIMFGEDEDALQVSVDIQADSLEKAIEIGRNYPVRKLLARGVSYDDGKPHLRGVYECK